MNIDIRSFEFTVKVGLLAYPGIHPTREHEINHLFCVLGNGYDWENGALVEKCDDEKLKAVERMLREGRPGEEIRAYTAEEDDKRWKDIVKNLPEDLKSKFREHMHEIHPLKVYPLCELCPILELPEDIRPDWLAGAEEALRLIETYPSYGEAQTIENRTKWAPLIRALIEKRRKSNGP